MTDLAAARYDLIAPLFASIRADSPFSTSALALTHTWRSGSAASSTAVVVCSRTRRDRAGRTQQVRTRMRCGSIRSSQPAIWNDCPTVNTSTLCWH